MHAEEDPAHETFDDLVRGLEIRAGRRLNQPHRSECAAAFATHPAGVRQAVAATLERTNGTNAVGLFIRMIRDGEHEIFDAAVRDRERAADVERDYSEYTWPTCVACEESFARWGNPDLCPACAEAEKNPDTAEDDPPASAPSRPPREVEPLDPATIGNPGIRRIVEESLARMAAAS